jgi:hypothetical protein
MTDVIVVLKPSPPPGYRLMTIEEGRQETETNETERNKAKRM